MNAGLNQVQDSLTKLRATIAAHESITDNLASFGQHVVPIGKATLLHLIDILLDQIKAAPDTPLPKSVLEDVPLIKRELDAAVSLVPQVGSGNAGHAAPGMLALLVSISVRLKPSLAWSEIPVATKMPEALAKRARELDVRIENVEHEVSKLQGRTQGADQVLSSVDKLVQSASQFGADFEEMSDKTKLAAESAKQAAESAVESKEKISATLKAATEAGAQIAASGETVSAAATQAVENAAKISAAVGQVTAHADSTAKAAQRTESAAEESSKLREKSASESDEIGKLLVAAKASAGEISAKQAEVTEVAASVKASTEETHTQRAKAEAAAKDAASYAGQAMEAYRIVTTAGLAGAFNQRARNLTRQSIYWSVILVFALVAAAYIGGHRTEEISKLLGGDKTEPMVLLIQLLLSVLTVGAPVWLAWLSTKQVAHIFRLAEDYGYKAAVAKAYEGFKEEAVKIDKQFEARLFASALERFNENPIRLVADSQPGSPLQDFLQHPAVQKLMDTAPEAKDAILNAVKGVVEKNFPKASGVEPPKKPS